MLMLHIKKRLLQIPYAIIGIQSIQAFRHFQMHKKLVVQCVISNIVAIPGASPHCNRPHFQGHESVIKHPRCS